MLTLIEHFNYLLLDKSHWKVSPVQSKVVYYHETEAHSVIEYELADPLYRTGYAYFFLNQPDVRPMWRTIRLKYSNTYLLELPGNALNAGRYFTNSPLSNVISIEEPNDKIIYGYWVKIHLNIIYISFF